MLFRFIGDPLAKNPRLEPEEIIICRQLTVKECAERRFSYPQEIKFIMPRMEPIEIDDEFLALKLMGNSHFEVVNGDIHNGGLDNEGVAKTRGPGRPRKSLGE